MKKLPIILFLFVFGFGLSDIIAQKFCDLELSIVAPGEGEIIPYGDTANLQYAIKNLGPDTLDVSDTIYFRMEEVQVSSYIYANLIPGDSVVATFLSAWSTIQEDETLNACLYLLKDLNESITDTVANNDSACVTFILEGNASSIFDVNKYNPENLLLHPNPADNQVYIGLEGMNLSNAEIIIREITGREWLRKKVNNEKLFSAEMLSMDIGMLPVGIYLVELRSDKQSAVGKLVVK